MIASVLSLTVSGAVDCEAFRQGVVGQPANATSSMAYALVGVAILVSPRRLHRSRASSFVFGGCLVAIGLGSVAFHGPRPPGAQLLHDLPIALLLGLMVLIDIALIFPRFQHVFPTLAGGGLIVAVAALVIPGLAAGIAAGLVPALVVLEVIVHRRALRPRPAHEQRRIVWALSILAGIAGVFWLLGRTDSPVCHPDTVLQIHAAWHVSSAVVFGIWWWLALAGGHERDEVETVHSHDRLG